MLISSLKAIVWSGYFTVYLRESFGKKIEWDTKMRYVERVSQDPYFVLDIRGRLPSLGKLGFFAEASHMTNTDYVESGTVQMPRRWFRAGFVGNLE